MAKPLTSWLVPSFSQHNLRPVVSGCCLHFSVTKFQDKFTSLRQVNSLSSWEKFQISCTDMYLIRFLPNFAVFCVFLWISRLCDRAKYQKPRLTMSCIIYKLATKNLHLSTIFLQLVTKRRPGYFFNFEPCGANLLSCKGLAFYSVLLLTFRDLFRFLLETTKNILKSLSNRMSGLSRMLKGIKKENATCRKFRFWRRKDLGQ